MFDVFTVSKSSRAQRPVPSADVVHGEGGVVVLFNLHVWTAEHLLVLVHLSSLRKGGKK